MKTIEINIPDGKKAIQEEKDGNIIIRFEAKPKAWTEMDSFEEFYEAADAESRKSYDDDHSVSVDGIAYKQLRLITRFTNTDPESGKRWIPDWNNSSQKKWGNYFNLSFGSGFSDSTSYYDYDDANASVGSRLCFETQRQADGIRKKFYDLYIDYLTIKN